MAFLSYSHQDAALADWLHEELEAFKVPSRLVGKLTDQGVVPKKLSPIFRDRQELAASHDLGEEIEEAIENSRFLIVLCSPAAANSRWIGEEIACFKRLHGEDRILAAILDGEPFASDLSGREKEECFPAELRFHFDGRGRPTRERAEPIAADLREQGDGRKMGFLKIAAGMLGVGLDDLAQREAQRRQRRLYAITAASVAGMLFTSGLAYTAIDARDAARDQRREAEGLIAFMLGDLRKKLEPVGRLDVLDSVGTRALAYYEKQDKSDLPDESLAQRSRALTLMGEMAQARGDLEGALRRYREAMATTAEAVERAPDNPQHLYDHAQNVFWVGSIDYQRGNLDRATAAFQQYRRLADRMIALAPGEDRYRLERIYAESNLGTVLMDQRKYREAAEAYQRLLEPSEALLAKEPANQAYQLRLLNALGWLAEAREFSGQIDEAIAHRQRQLALLGRLWDAQKPHMVLKQDEMTARRALARLLAYRGQMEPAIAQARQASLVADWLTRTEPRNADWIQRGAQANFDRSGLELAAGNLEQARLAAKSACDSSARLSAMDRSVSVWRTNLQLRCAKSNAMIAIRTGQASEAAGLARQALVLARTEQDETERGLEMARAELLLGDALGASGQRDAAKSAYERAIAAWPNGIEEHPRELAERAYLLRRLGRSEEARTIVQQLTTMGYRHPDYRRVIKQGV
ncbi:MAG TPA: toll/interleukin-1 receptor domain-containing protein [Sphingomicrobium sp.]|nr:toll/interleukin-1 receptor domain-containing protein [Sphingomicrobium sp.]